MDFDPGFHEEIYDEGFDDGQEMYEENLEQSEEEVELDSMGNPIFLAAAGGFGYHMAQGEIDERQIAENILKNKARKVEVPVKVPLSHRHNQKGHMTPFGRWSTRVNMDHSKINDEIEYTIEERLQIMDSEGDWDG